MRSTGLSEILLGNVTTFRRALHRNLRKLVCQRLVPKLKNKSPSTHFFVPFTLIPTMLQTFIIIYTSAYPTDTRLPKNDFRTTAQSDSTNHFHFTSLLKIYRRPQKRLQPGYVHHLFCQIGK